MLLEVEPRAVRRTGDEVEIDLHVPRDLAYFPDHFPEQPMLPGVVQTGWAVRHAERLFGLSQLQRLTGLKFLHPILPGVELRLTLVRKGSDVSFSYANAERECSSGRLRFAP